MRIVGIVPAAGYATRLQPLDCSKEVLPVGGRPVMDHAVERLRAGGADEVVLVTRPEKDDVVAHARELGLSVVLGHPPDVAHSFALGMAALAPDDLVLLDWPDILWGPPDGHARTVAAVRDEGHEVALGLFRTPDLTRSDVVELAPDGRILGIQVKPAEPPSEWIWGCACARVETFAGLAGQEWPGRFLDGLCRAGRDVVGIPLSSDWLDIGTPESLARATGADATSG
ncbi:MAG: NTP transferase domain-containing protein [Thermoleophilia bacterium]